MRAGNPSSQGVGLLFSHQVRFMPDKRTSIVGSVIFFDTDSFDSRLYAYENDVRGVFANQAAFGRGTRWFLLVLFNISEALQISAKYAETYRDDVKTIGSGADQIPGNTKSRLNVQLDMVL